MDDEAKQLLRDLLTGSRVVCVAVLAENRPVAGLLPFVPAADGSALLVQASRLAKHSRGLSAGAPWSGLIHARDAEDADPLQLPRVTLEGTVEPVPPDGVGAARAAYLARFPTAEITAGLGDFTFHRLRIEGGRLVAGFGRAFNLSAASLRELV